MEERRKVRFTDLSVALQIAIVIVWIGIGLKIGSWIAIRLLI